MGTFLKNKHRVLSLAIVILSLFLAVLTSSDTVMAAETVKINVVSTSAEVGDEVSVKVEVTASAALVGGEIYINFDSSILQYVSSGSGAYAGGGVVKLNNAGESAYTIKFKALKAGTSSVTVDKGSTVMAAGTDIDSNVTVSNGSVTVKAPVTYSSENRLSSLTISPGVLSPSFSAGTTDYTTTVGEDVSKLVVSAKPKDDKATVSVSGTTLSAGTNTVKITVKAEDGSTKVYKITVTKPSGETQAPTDAPVETKVKVGDKEYKIIGDFTAYPLPGGFEAFEYDLDGTKVQAGKGTNNKLIIMYLHSDEEGAVSGFYVYDSVTKTYTLYNEISQPDTRYIVLPITDTMELPVEWEKTTISINDKDTMVLMHEDKRYCAFYAVNSSGVSGWYLYDTVDSTVMSFDIVTALNKASAVVVNSDDDAKDTSGSNTKMWIIIVAVLSVVTLASVIAAIISLHSAKKSKKAFSAAISNSDDELSDDYMEDGDDELEDSDDELEDVLADDEDVLSEDEEALEIDGSDEIDELEINEEDEEEELELFDLDDEEK